VKNRMKTWMLGIGLAWLFLLPRGVLCGPAQSRAEVAKALDEMASLESRIEEAQKRHWEEQQQILKTNRSLQSISNRLEEKTRLREEGRRFFDSYGEQAEKTFEAVQAQITADRQKLHDTEDDLALVCAVLLAESASDASPPDSILGLALAQAECRDKALVSTQRVMRLEAELSEMSRNRDDARETAGYHSVFAQYGLEQLNARHEALARQVSRLEAQADRRFKTMKDLGEERDKLKNLLARLAERETEPSAEAVDPHPTQPSKLAEATPTTQGIFQPPMNATGGGEGPKGASDVAEVPYENGAGPLATQLTETTGGDQTSSEGRRFLFWRVKPVGTRALASGRGVFSGPFAGYRHLLIIDHGGGWRTLYGNMTECSLLDGELVRVGQPLGRYQASQGSRADPLWFEVRQGTTAVEPKSWPALPSNWERKLLAYVTE
jgi:murein hydrolase activator